MIVLYNLAIFLLGVGVRIAALFHPKAKAFAQGRKRVFHELAARFQHQPGFVVWIHCASLGEFEQGRPLIEALKERFPDVRVLLTFFSPSGYEVRKNYDKADYVCYMPLDTAANARRFLSLVKPDLAIFVKYEFWHHFARTLRKSNIPLLSVSAIFRQDQLFFQSYGGFYRNILKQFSFFFVQNDESVRLLQSIGIHHVKRAGDTRFDRVYQVVQQAEEIAIAKSFKADQKVLVVGSSWTEDLDVLIPFINEDRLKFIIAPHEINESSLVILERSLQVRSVRYSRAAQTPDLEEARVLIIDNVGMLSRLYRYGEFAYVGGAFGKGLHNILEAACYGVPIFFGNRNYEKFQEAVDLINRGGAFEISDYPDFKAKYEMLNIPENFLLACEVTRQYVEENLGATRMIIDYVVTTSKIRPA
ncbi:3-deoxy-D-manno-octulosonic acid transferase [Fulvivirgaceae bacterium PWU5]|uniref:3-deoxy-D-manno-octulosonic acid transferase n=1 Tax=Dawidia cretensis TaxID=2782350 RepID=A0AAP2GQZ6_9BACT|nr:glycosyltransferase N-terminal domain-containing protein [Dawidia cretensis]MBT1710216.1 3-deoxy-D-manno-octulosonic acid transferase [Dawidia cretensis]